MDITVKDVAVEDRPISEKKLSGLSNFFGLYGGEHIAATEFVIGATLVTFGVKMTDIFIGLFVGNILATLTYAFICAPIAVDTRLTLYSYLGRVLGTPMQKIYNVVWGICSIAMAASMLTVSASAVREILNFSIQEKWYPTDIKFVIMVIILGIIVTLVAVNGFESVAKFSSVCAPWMIVVFLAGYCVVLPQLSKLTGEEVHSFSDFLTILNTSVCDGTVADGVKKLSIFHVIGFAWMCNLAYHAGLNDMALFRYAKSSKYGMVTAYGMFVGHFFAWGSAGIMGAVASKMLQKPLAALDSGAITGAVLGITGLLAVIIAGWTTANPNIYRAGLAFQSVTGCKSFKKVTYFVGTIMTIAACFPITANIMTIVNIIVLVVPSIGAIVFAEHWIIPKLGGYRYWSKYKGWNLNYAGLIAWVASLLFVVFMTMNHVMHSYFLFLPTYMLAMILYIVLALAMGAKDDYSKQAAEENEFIAQLKNYVETIDEEEPVKVPIYESAQKMTAYLSYVVLAAMVLVTLGVFFGGFVSPETYKTISIFITLAYFVLGGLSAYLKYGLVKTVDVEEAAKL